MTDFIAFDTETHLIQPGLLAPPLVCASVASTQDITNAITIDTLYKNHLLNKHDARSMFRNILESQSLLMGANIAYDMGVMVADDPSLIDLIFDKYQRKQVFDIQIAEILHAIGKGTLGKDPRTNGPLKDPISGKPSHYSLAVCTDLVLGRVNAKQNDKWRLSYALLEDIPIEEWPIEARQYPIDDAVNTLEVGLAQLGQIPHMELHDWSSSQTCSRCGVEPGPNTPRGCAVTGPRMNLHDHAAQVFASWCLHLGAMWGLRTDGDAIAALEAAAMHGRIAGQTAAIAMGFMRDNGTENQAVVKRAVAIAYGADPLSKCRDCDNGRIVTEVLKKVTCIHCKGMSSVATPNELVTEYDDKGRQVIDISTDLVVMTLCDKCQNGEIEKITKSDRTCSTCNGTNLELPRTVPRTEASASHPNGQIQIGRDTLTESGDDDLMAYAVAQEDDKILDTYIPFLKTGIDIPISLRPNNPLETGRVSYKDPTQTIPRAVSAHLAAELKRMNAPIGGVRDCFVPRPGWLYFSVDYTGGELVTFAESCVNRVGYSEMGKALNSGIDVHSDLGASMMGERYDTFLDMRAGKHGPLAKKRATAFRHAAKSENFGNPGGMGAVKKVIQQRKQGPDTPHPSGPSMVDDGNGGFVPGYKGLRFCVLTGGASRCGEKKVTEWKDRSYPPVCLACIESSERGRDAWFKKWPEARPYLAWHSQNVERNGYVTQLYSNRIRGGTDFTSEANGDFQALLADIAKRALCRVVTEQYTDRSSPVYGSRTILFAHDELFGEVPEDRGSDACARIVEIMVDEFRKGCPSHLTACKAEPTLMRRWRKNAEPAYHDGKLIAWETRHDYREKAAS